MDSIDRLFDYLCQHEMKFARSFSLIPSENMLSPTARLAFMSDGYSRYFFDEKEVFGRWSFQGGSIIGDIQRQILFPTLQRLGKAKFVDVHSISGLSGMTLALAAFGGVPGNKVMSVPVEMGGHPDTQYVAQKLGYVSCYLPGDDWATPNFERLGQMVADEELSLVYIDHATALFPFDQASLYILLHMNNIHLRKIYNY